jgi:hypothetical protein
MLKLRFEIGEGALMLGCCCEMMGNCNWGTTEGRHGTYQRWCATTATLTYFDTAFMRFSRLWKEHGPCFIFESLLTFECQKGHDEPRWTRIMLRLCSRNQDDGFNKVMQHWQWLLISGSCGLCLMSPLWNDNPNRLFRMCLKPTTRLQTVPCECIVTIHDLHEQTQIPSDWDSLSLQILTPPLTVFFFQRVMWVDCCLCCRIWLWYALVLKIQGKKGIPSSSIRCFGKPHYSVYIYNVYI